MFSHTNGPLCLVLRRGGTGPLYRSLGGGVRRYFFIFGEVGRLLVSLLELRWVLDTRSGRLDIVEKAMWIIILGVARR